MSLMTYSTTQEIASRATAAKKARRPRVTVATLAQALNVSESTMKRRLAGTYPWDSDEIVKAAEILGVEPDYLLLGERGAA